jgi:hypothetical protein
MTKEKNSQLVLMNYYIDQDSAKKAFEGYCASGLYSMVELVEFRRLGRWEDHG